MADDVNKSTGKDFAVELAFDSTATAQIRAVWQELAENGVNSFMLDADVRPHLTLGICEAIDIESFKPNLLAFTKSLRPFVVTFNHVGVFPIVEGVVFLGATVTKRLAKVHWEFHQIFGLFAQNQNNYYLPDYWVPHCTMAYGLEREKIPDAVEFCSRAPFPITAHIEKVVLVEVSSKREVLICDLDKE